MSRLFKEEYSAFDTECMSKAIFEAKKAFNIEEVPIGCVIAYNNQIICSKFNQIESKKDATQHAEIQCIQEACSILDRWRLKGCTLYVTLEPCLMCLGAIINARISRVVWSLDQTRRDDSLHIDQLLQSTRSLGPSIEFSRGLMLEESKNLLQTFFKKRRRGEKSSDRAAL